MQLRSQIVAGERRHVLNEFFVIEFEFGDDEVFATHRSFPVHGNGSTQQEAPTPRFAWTWHRSRGERSSCAWNGGAIARRLRDVMSVWRGSGSTGLRSGVRATLVATALFVASAPWAGTTSAEPDGKLLAPSELDGKLLSE
jgi:hypothetical protein